jgi:tryptophanase
MADIAFFRGEPVPMEMHKARMVQKLTLAPVEDRRRAILEAGGNTFLLRNRDIFLDMLSDSGVNAMSEKQTAAMFLADDSYAGSESFYRLTDSVENMFGTEFFLPAHQGRAAENILTQAFVKPKPGSTAIMNYHFTTTKALITYFGGNVEEIVIPEGLQVTSDHPFKGDMDLGQLASRVDALGVENISFVRIEAGTNLIGGQPVSLANFRAVSEFCRARGILFVVDASLLSDNMYFMAVRDPDCRGRELVDISREIGQLADIVYFSARKLGCARGGGIATNSFELYDKMREFVPLFEGFLTYGGMSVREIEAIAVGLREALDFEVINQTPIFVAEFSRQLVARGIPVVTPPGGLGLHLDATRFHDHLDQSRYPAGALAAAVFIAAGVRGMERGTMSEQREADGSERFAEMELLRLAMPKRVYTLSHIDYIVDRLSWLYENRRLIGGLRYVEEPAVLRFFFGRLEPDSGWMDDLVAAFRRDLGDSL